MAEEEEELQAWDNDECKFMPILDDDSSSSSSSSSDEEEDEDGEYGTIPVPRGIEPTTSKYKKIVEEEELLPE